MDATRTWGQHAKEISLFPFNKNCVLLLCSSGTGEGRAHSAGHSTFYTDSFWTFWTPWVLKHNPHATTSAPRWCPHQDALGSSHPECQWGWLWCCHWMLSCLNISLPAARAPSLLKDNFSSVTYVQKLFTLGFSSSICWRISLCFSTSFSCLLLWASSSCQKRESFFVDCTPSLSHLLPNKHSTHQNWNIVIKTMNNSNLKLHKLHTTAWASLSTTVQ